VTRDRRLFTPDQTGAMVTRLDERVLVAHADAWQAEGRLRAPFGGGACQDPGARLASSGLPFARWNGGDLVDLAKFDPAAARAWYAQRAFGAGVPWGLRVPADTAFPFGRLHVKLHCLALEPEQFMRPALPGQLRLGVAIASDVTAVARIDAVAFDAPFDECLQWNAPHLDAAGFTVVLASWDGEPIGTATAVLTDDRAGRSVTLFGVGVLAPARGRGVGAAMTAWLIERAFDAGATLAHLNPNNETAARLYARLGFVETRGIDVYADI